MVEKDILGRTIASRENALTLSGNRHLLGLRKMNRFEKDVKRTVGEILDEHGFSFASDLSQHPSDCLVFRSPEVLLRISWDRGDVLTDVSPNQDKTQSSFPVTAGYGNRGLGFESLKRRCCVP